MADIEPNDLRPQDPKNPNPRKPKVPQMPKFNFYWIYGVIFVIFLATLFFPKDMAIRTNWVRVQNDMIMLKPLNQEALYGMEDIQPHILNYVISKGYKPSYDRPKLIHYRYANEFEVIPQIENQ